jgi:hypothetical protein
MLVKLIALDVLQVFGGSDDFIAVRMLFKRGFLHGIAEQEERFIQVAGQFRKDDRPFRFHFLRVEQAVDHAVRFEFQRERQMIGGQGFKVGRPVHVGKGVPAAAGTGNGFIRRTGRKTRCAFELHVLHPVGNSAFAVLFIARADPVPYPMTDQRGGMDFFQLYGQTVGELGAQDVFSHGKGRSTILRITTGKAAAAGFRTVLQTTNWGFASKVHGTAAPLPANR